MEEIENVKEQTRILNEMIQNPNGRNETENF